MTIDEALADLRRKRAAIRGSVAVALDDVAEGIVKQIKAIWPVDTGKSRKGWYYTRSRSSLIRSAVSIKNDVPYTGNVHDGKAAKMLPDLARQAEPLFHRLFLEAMRRA